MQFYKGLGFVLLKRIVWDLVLDIVTTISSGMNLNEILKNKKDFIFFHIDSELHHFVNTTHEIICKNMIKIR